VNRKSFLVLGRFAVLGQITGAWCLVESQVEKAGKKQVLGA
jgi:hypothetical protein